jgi:class 3 adenylate cyclase/peptidoglycan hydrolase-like protein with peptidoglycan-binding domain
MANRPRRLCAILHADIAGYVRLMEADEERTVDHLQTVRANIWRPAIGSGGGSVVNIEGDSVLAEFGSAATALATAVDIQERMALFNGRLEEDRRLRFRIGLHLGEVIVDRRTRSIFGDGVNLAARIQAMAEPGGIAVSRALRDAAEGCAEYEFIDGGEHRAKNVSRPLQLYHVRPAVSGHGTVQPSAARRRRRPSAMARVARHGWNARLTMRGPALWGATAAAVLLLAGGGYFAYQANTPATVSAVALSLSAEQLEQALAERRTADALALEKRQLEGEARHKATVGAEAKRQAEEDLERARQARQKAEDDLAKLRADIAARRQSEAVEAALRRTAEEAAQRKAEDEAAGLRQAEEAAKVKATADAEAKRQADEALAQAESERQQAEREAQRKADAEQAALRRASEESAVATLARQKEEWEAAEKGLGLDQTARTRLQVALTSLGFDTRGSDGILGPRTREMIAAWQKARRVAPTGFLTALQQRALLKEGAAAVAKYDEQRNAEEDVSPPTAVAVSLAAPLPAPLASPSADGSAVAALERGSYRGAASNGNNLIRLQVSLQVADGHGVGALASPGCQQSPFVVSVSSVGAINGDVYFNCIVSGGGAGTTIGAGDFKITGEYQGKEILLSFRSARQSFIARLAAKPSPVAAALPVVATSPAAATPSVASPDGLWRGAYTCGAASNLAPPFTIPLELRVSNGSAIWKGTRSWTVTVAGTLEIRLVVSGNSVSVTRSFGLGQYNQGTLSGHYDGVSISAAGRERGVSSRECSVSLSRL